MSAASMAGKLTLAIVGTGSIWAGTVLSLAADVSDAIPTPGSITGALILISVGAFSLIGWIVREQFKQSARTQDNYDKRLDLDTKRLEVDTKRIEAAERLIGSIEKREVFLTQTLELLQVMAKGIEANSIANTEQARILMHLYAEKKP